MRKTALIVFAPEGIGMSELQETTGSIDLKKTDGSISQ